jgi:hypothetical protein
VRFLNSIFGGWNFRPEKGSLALVGMVGRKFVEVRFTCKDLMYVCEVTFEKMLMAGSCSD